jgi:hypothetical protein
MAKGEAALGLMRELEKMMQEGEMCKRGAMPLELNSIHQ